MFVEDLEREETEISRLLDGFWRFSSGFDRRLKCFLNGLTKQVVVFWVKLAKLIILRLDHLLKRLFCRVFILIFDHQGDFWGGLVCKISSWKFEEELEFRRPSCSVFPPGTRCHDLEALDKSTIGTTRNSERAFKRKHRGGTFAVPGRTCWCFWIWRRR